MKKEDATCKQCLDNTTTEVKGNYVYCATCGNVQEQTYIEEKPQVNFEKINFEEIDKMLQYSAEEVDFEEPMIMSEQQYTNSYNNFKLFFKTLAKNPSFAHKASKELKKLLK